MSVAFVEELELLKALATVTEMSSMSVAFVEELALLKALATVMATF
jgi:hypothetical protein